MNVLSNRQWDLNTCANDLRQFGTFLKSPHAKLEQLMNGFAAVDPMLADAKVNDTMVAAIKSEIFRVIEVGIPAIVDSHVKQGFGEMCMKFYIEN